MPLNKDIQLVCQGLKELGVGLEQSEDTVTIIGTGGSFKHHTSYLYTGDSGTFSRFIVPLVAFAGFPITVEGSKQMNSRPMLPLFEALQQLGVDIEPNKDNHFGFLPAKFKGPYYR